MDDGTLSGNDGTGPQSASRRLEFFRKLTEARLANADDNFDLAYSKFKDLLALDPENQEAMDFIQRFEAGDLNKPEAIALPQAGSGITIQRPREPGPAPKEKPRVPLGDYAIRELYIVNSGGMLIGHFNNEGDSIIDKDIMMGMLSAMQMFIQDTFDKPGIYLRHMDLAQFDVLICSGRMINIYAIVSGMKTTELRPQLERLLTEIEADHSEKIKAWKGKMSDLRWLQALILKLITGGYMRKT